ncbi:FtsB family cell division protein [Myroides sp. LJL116]
MQNNGISNKFSFLKNRWTLLWILSLFLFLLWILIFDTYSLLEHRHIDKEIKKLQGNKAYFENEIRKDKQAIKGLRSGDATEKYAREKYYMKRDNEDIFIIEFDSLPQK